MSLDLFIDHMRYAIGLAVCLHLRTTTKKETKTNIQRKNKNNVFLIKAWFSFISLQFLLLVSSPAAVIIYSDNTISERKVFCVVLFCVFAFFFSRYVPCSKFSNS